MDIRTKPRSRFYAQPIGKRIAISPRDFEIFKLLNRYKYAPTDFAHAFVGGHLGRLKNRLTDLRHEGYLSCPDSQFKTANARYRHLVYELGSRGRSVLAEHGVPLRSFDHLTGPFAHDLMSCQAVASLELAARDSGLRFITPDEIVAKAGIADQHLFKYRISISWKGRQEVLERFTPDWEAFGLQGSKFLPIVGLETDAHTETLRPSDLKQSSIAKKILAYDQLDRDGVFQRRFRLKSDFYVILFLTVNETHKRNIMGLVKEIAGPSEIFLFKTITHFSSWERSTPPTPELLTTPWDRVGYPPFVLLQPEE